VERRSDIFTGFVRGYLRIKQESSGYPAWVKNDSDKKAYIADYEKRQGVTLRPDKIQKNPGLRACSKLCLCSLWGKTGQRMDLPRTVAVKSKREFMAIWLDPSKRITDIPFVTEDVMEIVYRERDEILKPGPFSNIYVAALTTAYARIALYNAMATLDDPKRVLYCDTDSIIYSHEEGQNDLKTGDLLGELTDELDGGHITELVSPGPKNYGYTVKNADGTESTELKIKGFSLKKSSTAALLNYQSMRSCVLGEIAKISVPNKQFLRTKDRHINMKNNGVKVYSNVARSKREFNEDGTSTPYLE
jgi:hypothetical protein